MYKTLSQNCVFFFLLFSSIILSSCTSTKNVPYFKDINQGTEIGLASTAKFSEPLIQPDDILSVSVFTIDPASNMIINQVASQAINSNIQSNVQSQSTLLSATPSTSGFLVDKSGEIDLAVIGKIKVLGLTTGQAREKIKERASIIYTNPNVQVRFANFKVTVLGEVLRPSSYLVPNEKVSVLDALGLAGDLTIYGKRENVLLIRDNWDGKKEFARLNLNSKDLFSSPYFYLKQNDVIYVEPNKGKAASLNQARTQTLAVVASALSVLVVLFTRK